METPRIHNIIYIYIMYIYSLKFHPIKVSRSQRPSFPGTVSFFLVVKKNPSSGAEIWSCVCFTEKKNIINPPFFYQFWDEISLLHQFSTPLIPWNLMKCPSSRSVENRENRLLRAVPSISRSSWVSSLWKSGLAVTRMFLQQSLLESRFISKFRNPDLFPSFQRFMKVNWGVSSYVHLEESQFMLSLVLVRRRRIHQCNGQGQPTRPNCFIPAFIATNWICQKVPQLSRKKWQLYTTQKWPPSIPTKYDITYLSPCNAMYSHHKSQSMSIHQIWISKKFIPQLPGHLLCLDYSTLERLKNPRWPFPPTSNCETSNPWRFLNEFLQVVGENWWIQQELLFVIENTFFVSARWLILYIWTWTWLVIDIN